jgi:hypothetical protein
MHGEETRGGRPQPDGRRFAETGDSFLDALTEKRRARDKDAEDRHGYETHDDVTAPKDGEARHRESRNATQQFSLDLVTGWQCARDRRGEL